MDKLCQNDISQVLSHQNQYRSDSVGMARVLADKSTLKKNPKLVNHFSPQVSIKYENMGTKKLQ